MNDPREREMLIEEATTAWRPRTPDGIILEHPAWADLDPDSRGAVFDETVVARRRGSAQQPAILRGGAKRDKVLAVPCP